MRRKIVGVTLIVFLVFTQCGHRKDNPGPKDEPPKVEDVSVSPVATTDIVCGQNDHRVVHLASSQTFKINFKVSSPEGLSQYKVDIHHNFDCHSHRREEMLGTVWKLIKTRTISGNEQFIKEELEVPSDVVAGNYHFMLQVVDVLGNEAAMELYTLKVRNEGDTEAPTITVSLPASDPLMISKSDSVYFDLVATDNRTLAYGRIEITYFDASQTEFTVDQYHLPTNAGTSVRYKHAFTISPLPANGVYEFVIKAFDAVGNMGEKRQKVHVAD